MAAGRREVREMLKKIYEELIAIRKELQKTNSQLKPFDVELKGLTVFRQIQELATKHRM